MKRNFWNKFDRTKNGVLVIKFKDLERVCYHQLKDWDKHYFDKPKRLNVDEFIEFYLGLNLRWKHFVDEDIYGMTIIEDGVLETINEDGQKELTLVRKGEIYINASQSISQEIILVTMLHESKHGQTDLDVSPKILKYDNGELRATLSGKQYNETSFSKDDPLYFMERQAQKYAIYLLMPSPFVRKVFKQMKEELFDSHGKKMIKKNLKTVWVLIFKMAKFFGVSKLAMKYRLYEMKLIGKRIKKYLEEETTKTA